MNNLTRTICFGVATGLYSLATTYLSVGFPLQTKEDIVRIVALFVVAAFGGGALYRVDPEAAFRKLDTSSQPKP